MASASTIAAIVVCGLIAQQGTSPAASALDAACTTTGRYERVAAATGPWTDPATWGGGAAPRPSHDVCVPAGVEVWLAANVAGTAASVNGAGTIRVGGNAGTSLTIGNSLYSGDSWIGALDVSGPGLASAPGVRGHANLSVGTLRWSSPVTGSAKDIKGAGSLAIRTAWHSSGARPLVMRRAVTVEQTAEALFDGPQVNFTGPRALVNRGTVAYTASMVDFRAGYGVVNHGRFVLGSGPSAPALDAEVRVPATIDGSGATDVTAQVQAFIDSVPDGATAAFDAGATYRVEGTVLVSGRESFTIDANGATFVARTDGAGAAPPRGMFATKWPRRRVHFMIDRGSDVSLRELKIRGGHPGAGMSDGAYVEELEGQHGVEFRGVVGGRLHQCEISDVYGDFVSVSGGATDVVVSDCHMARNGRQGISMTDAHDVVVERNVIADVRRSAIDVEPASANWSVTDVVVRDNDIGPFRLMGLASKGAGGNVRDIALERNRFVGSPLQVYAGAARGARRGTYRVVDNTSDTPLGSPNAAMRFVRIDGVEVRGNVQHLNPTRSGIGVSTVESCGVDVAANSFPGGTTELQSDGYACSAPAPAPAAAAPPPLAPAAAAPLDATVPAGADAPVVTVGNGGGSAGTFTNDRSGVVETRGGRATIAMSASNDGLLQLSGSGATFSAGLTNGEGRIFVPPAAALVVSGGDFVQTGPAAATRVDGAMRVASGHVADIRDGMLRGDGAIVAGTVRSAGILQPGSGSPASLLVEGHFEQDRAGTLRVTVRDGVPDSLTVTGRATLGGRLVVSTSGAPAAKGSLLPVVTYASSAGAFDDLWGTLVGAAAPGLVYAPTPAPAALSLAVTDVPSVSVTAVSVTPTAATFTLTRAGTTAVPAAVDFRTDVPDDATAATPDVDFTTTFGVATFGVGDSVQKVTVAVLPDGAVEADEVLWLRLRRTPHGQVASASAVATAVIPGNVL